jgi:hypothetical protein
MTLQELLAGDGQPATRGEVEVYVPRALIADLYDHPVIITPEYIGRDRRISSGSEGTGSGSQLVTIDRRVPVVPTVLPSVQHEDLRGPGSTKSLGALEALIIIVSTLALAVPLTLMAAGGKASAIAGTPASPRVAPVIAGSSGLGTAARQQASDRAARHADRVAARARVARSRSLKRATNARREAALRLQHRREVALRRAQAERKHRLLASQRTASRQRALRQHRARRY